MDIAVGIGAYLISFVAIWWGAGLIIKSVDKIARRLKLSSFAISFFVLGILTSIPETAVGIQSLSDRKPEIFVGNLLGGVIVLFLLVIPVLAILGKGVRINHDLDTKNILYTLFAIALPGVTVLDRRVTNLEGVVLIVVYAALFYLIQRKHGIFDHGEVEIMKIKAYSFMDLLKVMLGVGVVFVSSRYIVDQTVVFSMLLHIPAYYISLLALSVGTNLPELSLAIRSVLSGKKDIAFGDYLGSAAANTLLFGIFTLVNDGEVLTTNSFAITFGFIAAGLALFYYFSRSRRDISVREGWILLSVYALFVIYEAGRAAFIVH